jgi:diketogulonate reductase-like aldo/keto reductase
MEYKAFGRTGHQVSEIGMGTYYDPLWIAKAFLGWRSGAAEKIDALNAGFDAGITLVNTAEVYGSEPLVAKALQGRKREELFVSTKVSPIHLHRDAIKRSLEKSLRRLGLSYVDLYLVHFPNPRVPIAETMAGMEDLIREGKIHSAGVSNFNIGQLREANEALPKSQIASVELEYNLRNRRVEAEILPYCDKEGIALLAYFPLAHGKLTSDSRLRALCSKLGKTPSQLALRWLAMKPNVFPIPRASKRAHVLEDAGASGWELTPADALELESIYQ